MIQSIILAGGQGAQGQQVFDGVKSFRVTAPSFGSTYSVDDGTANPLNYGDSVELTRRWVSVRTDNGQVVMRKIYGRLMLTPGATAPLAVTLVYDSGNGDEGEELAEDLKTSPPPVLQEGDIGVAASAGAGSRIVAIQGAPALFRNPSVANGLQIPTSPITVGGVLQVVGNGSSIVLSDSTAAAGAALDTGVVNYGGNTIGLYIEVSFGAVLTGSRTLDVRLVRADASQMSLFDPIRNAASPITLAIGRASYLGAIGEFMGGAGATGAVASGMDTTWSFPLPAGSVTNGIRVALGAGGAEVPRIRIFERISTTV